MKPVVRAFLFNPLGEILFTKHKKDTPWVLPGGHVEAWEALHEAITRELREEFSISARFFEIDSEEILSHKWKRLNQHPLPISSYDLSYTSKDGSDRSRTEYIYLMETDDEISDVQIDEIHEYAWFDPEKILSMKPNVETWDFYIEMLERIIGDEELGE